MICPHDRRPNLELKQPSGAHAVPRSFDHLEIILPLGRGGYSQVYLAQCRESKVEYVLKCLSSSGEKKKNTLEEQSWIDEFNIGHRISSLSHTRLHFLLPTIAKFKSPQNQRCLVFPYSGPLVPLYKCLASSSTRLNEDQIRLYMAQLICATTTLHSELGIIHRDIKSGNIMGQYPVSSHDDTHAHPHAHSFRNGSTRVDGLWPESSDREFCVSSTHDGLYRVSRRTATIDGRVFFDDRRLVESRRGHV